MFALLIDLILNKLSYNKEPLINKIKELSLSLDAACTASI